MKLNNNHKKTYRFRGLTLFELVMTAAIVFTLAGGIVFYVQNYTTFAQNTVTTNTLQTLNKALDAYKTQGGMSIGNSLSGPNTSAKMTAVISALKTGITSNGVKMQFLERGFPTTISGLTGWGKGKNFYFLTTGNTISVGSASSQPIISLSGNLSFGAVAQNSSATSTLTIKNNGGTSMSVSSISYPTGFSGNWTSGTIAAGGTQSVTVTFSPTLAQNYGDNIVVTSNASQGNNTILASGRGVSSTISLGGSVSGGTMSFGSISVGSTAVETLTITNTGSASITVSSITLPSGYTSNWASGTIAAGSTQYIQITFSPVAATTYNGTLTVNSNATSGTSTVSLTGIGSQSTISLSGSLAFGAVLVNSSATATFTITNSGSLPLTVSNITFGTYSTKYSVDWSSGKIAAGGSRVVTVTFTPTAVQSYNDTITVASDKSSGTNTISVTGAGGQPVISIRLPDVSLDFGNTVLYSTSTLNFLIKNTGNMPLNVTSITYPAAPNNMFSGAFSGTIAAGTSQSVTVSFTPTAASYYSGTITINSDAASGTNTAPVSGHGQDVSTGLRLYYSMDQSSISGDIISDLSGNNYDGTLINGPTSIAGVANEALEFDGNNTQEIDVSNNGSDTLTAPFTVHAWVRLSDDIDPSCFIGSRSPSEASFDAKLSGIYGIHGDIGDGISWITTSADYSIFDLTSNTLNIGTWYNIVYVVTNDTYKIYLDGAEVANEPMDSTGYPPMLFDADHQLVIGNNSVAGIEPMYGAIDEVIIYNRALSADEIDALYNFF